MAKTARISVRNLVEFILRKGSIDSRKVSNHTAQEGSRIHRKLQKAAGEAYQKEVFLKAEVQLAEYYLTVEGRADGVFPQGEGWCIDEIKSSEPLFEDLPSEQLAMFFNQLKVYGYLYMREHQLSEITLQLTYYQTTEQKITRQTQQHTFTQLEQFFNDLVAAYQEWLIFQDNWQQLRNSSLQELKFPYGEYRKGQRELAVAAYKTIRTRQKLFVEAPTGTGKTISTLFPALKAVGENNGDRIFYLTAKTITRQVAEDALRALKQAGAEVKSVTLTAKDKICFLTERNCTPEHCPFANGYYDRVNEGLWDLLNHENQLTREVIEVYAQKHQLCPFELALDASLWCDVIIGDYNYLFDPIVHLQRFFEEVTEDYLFLIDEVHNLVNRSREMYSAALSKSQVVLTRKGLATKHRKLRTCLNKVIKEFDAIEAIAQEDSWDYHHQKPAADSLLKALYKAVEKMQEWLAEYPEDPAQEPVLALFFDCLYYTRISEFYDEHYETTVTRSPRELTVKQFCIDPSPFLEASLNKGRASLLFSASLSPLPYYQQVLGGQESLAYRLPSPFPPERQRILVTNFIETTYRKRQAGLPLLIETLQRFVRGKTGNYLVFFPSYQYLLDAVHLFESTYPEIKLLVQEGEMKEEQREAFLAAFTADPQETLLGFCVLGGIFSEGIDLKGDRLIGTMVVGVGLPQINHEQELIKQYYDEEQRDGFAYAYQLPGMNKVLQAAGRVIRDAADQGIVVLADRRFNGSQYRQLFPRHWQQARKVFSAAALSQEVADFWQEQLF